VFEFFACLVNVNLVVCFGFANQIFLNANQLEILEQNCYSFFKVYFHHWYTIMHDAVSPQYIILYVPKCTVVHPCIVLSKCKQPQSASQNVNHQRRPYNELTFTSTKRSYNASEISSVCGLSFRRTTCRAGRYRYVYTTSLNDVIDQKTGALNETSKHLRYDDRYTAYISATACPRPSR